MQAELFRYNLATRDLERDLTRFGCQGEGLVWALVQGRAREGSNQVRAVVREELNAMSACAGGKRCSQAQDSQQQQDRR